MKINSQKASVPDIIFQPKKQSFISNLKKNKSLLFMCTPAIVFFFIFSYIPMPGVYLAFVRYNYATGLFHSPFCAFDNFRFLIISAKLLHLIINTFLYNMAFIGFGNILQVFVAILLNEIASKRFRKVSQTVMFLPYFISAVIIGLFAYNMLSYETGFVNNLLRSLGLHPIKAYSTPAIWPFIIIITNLWQTTGYGSIVYFATIMGIDSEIIEAASIDGANALQRIKYMILPSLKPTFIILLLFSLGGIMRGNFGLFYNLVGANNAVLFDKTDIIETFVFRALMNNFNFSMGSAVSLYQSAFGFCLVMLANFTVKKIEEDYSLF